MQKRTFFKRCGLFFAAISLAAGLSPALPIAGAEETEAPASSVTPVSTVDASLSTFDRVVMKVDDKPFFFNGIQVRDDKIVERMFYTDEQLKGVYQLAADNGFTVVNSQIYWQMVQPDQAFPATETAYISGGANADTNLSSASMQAKYNPEDESSQSMAYMKFDFSSIDGTDADAAKIRIYVNSMDSGTADLHLYGIADDSWDSTSITWNNTGHHQGYELSGTEGVDYFDLGVLPSYDPVNKAAVYDFDVTDFLNGHAYGDGKKASFILKNNTPVNVAIDGANGVTLAPQLVISRANVWDYSWVGKVIGWAEAANLKLELMWFGSDTTKHTMDSRVPYYVIRNYTKMQTAEGRVLLEKMDGIRLNQPVYNYRMSKSDPDLNSKEYTALKGMFDYTAQYNLEHGDKKTVVGCDISNEPTNSFGGISKDYWTQKAYTDGNYKSESEFIYDSYWKWSQNLGAAVKQSNYPVWTRINFHSDEFGYLYRNEEVRANGGVSHVDFVGYDPYVRTTDESFRYGLGLWYDTEYEPYNYARNLPMIMETAARLGNSDYLNLAALAGGTIYNLYNLMADDGNDMYNNGPGNVPVPKNPNIEGIKKTNFWLRTLWYDLATKQPDAAGGTDLIFFNEHADPYSTENTYQTATVTKKVRGMDVTYNTTNTGVGIAVVNSDTSLTIASKTASDFTLKDLNLYGPVSMTSGYQDENNNWVSTGDKPFSLDGNHVVVHMNDYESVRIQVLHPIPGLTNRYSVNEDFNNQGTGNSPLGWDISSTEGTVLIRNKPGVLDKSVILQRTSSSAGETYAQKSFDPVSGIVKIEAKVRKEVTNEWFGAPYIMDSEGNTGIAIAFDASSNIVAKNASGQWEVLEGYVRRAWYKLEIEINTDTDTYDLYINGIKRKSQAPLAAPLNNVAKVKFYTENNKWAGSFDSVKVFQQITGKILVEGLSLDTSEEDIKIGDGFSIGAVVTPADATDKTLVWTSSAPGIASVDQNGYVTGKALGAATITAAAKDGSHVAAIVMVNVVDSIPVRGVALDTTDFYFSGIIPGEPSPTKQLNAIVQPAAASNAQVTWSSSDPSIAAVDQNGRVTAVNSGSAAITAATVDGGFEATAMIHIPIFSESFDHMELADNWGTVIGSSKVRDKAAILPGAVTTVEGVNGKVFAFTASKFNGTRSSYKNFEPPVTGNKVMLNFDWNIGTPVNGTGQLRIQDSNHKNYISFGVPINGAGTILYDTKSEFAENEIITASKTGIHVAAAGFYTANTTYNVTVTLDGQNQLISFTLANKAVPSETVTVRDIPFAADTAYTNNLGALEVYMTRSNSNGMVWTSWLDNFNIYAETTGAIEGTVLDASNNPVSGAVVQIAVADSVYSDVTTANGSFHLGGIPAGSGYELVVTKAGYVEKTAIVDVAAGGKTAVTIIAEPSAATTSYILTGPDAVQTGETFQVTYGLSNVTHAVYAKSVTIHYDPSALEYVSENSLIDGFTVVGSTYGPGTVRLIEANTGASNAVAGTLDLLTLTFKALQQSVTASVYMSDIELGDQYGQVQAVTGGSPLWITIVPPAPAADKAELSAVIDGANAALTAARVLDPLNPRYGHYPQNAIDALRTAISAAREVLLAVNATQAQVDQAKDALSQALTLFQGAVNQTASIGDLAIMSSRYGAASADGDWHSLRIYDFNQDGKLDLFDLVSMAQLILNK